MIAIMVLRERWVLVGVVLDTGRESGEIVLRRAHVVRYWGTTNGLGELSAGPTPKTRLDPLPSVEGELRIPYHSLVFPLEVATAPWARAIGGES